MKKGQKALSSQKRRTRPGRAGDPALAHPPDPGAMAAVFQGCGVVLTQQQIEQFWLYHGLLRHHNIELNLTRVYNFTGMVLKLYVDSVLPARMIDLPSPLMDLGSGPGMPGIPLKIMHPDLEVFLAERRARRAAFLREVIDRLGLEGIGVIDRNITPDFERPFRGVITRALERIDQTLERIQGCLEEKGLVIFMKGPACEPELAHALERFGRRFALVEDASYRIGQTLHQRRLLVFERLDAPRRALADRAIRRHRVTAVASEQNSRYKGLKKLLAGRGIKKAGQALLAGARPVEETLGALPLRCLGWITSGEQLPPPENAPPGMEWLQLTDQLFQALDVFGTGGPLLLVEAPEPEPWSPQEGFPPGCTLLVPFQDPENTGTVIRSAAAFGVTQVILLSESANPFHPKALRASGGTALRVRLRQGPSLTALPPDLPVVALSADGQDMATAVFPPAFGLLAGMEGGGLPSLWRGRAVRIPMYPAVESLNAAAATTVALYEWRRRQKE
ncbi:MAG: RsmG family class I SAM-dependent methyltransferase [Thermodesulfobacteriota bacterium]